LGPPPNSAFWIPWAKDADPGQCGFLAAADAAQDVGDGAVYLIGRDRRGHTKLVGQAAGDVFFP